MSNATSKLVINSVEYELKDELARNEISSLGESLELKADKVEVEESLELKADKVEVEESLELKADKTEVNANLELKADKTEVEESLELKADTTEVEDTNLRIDDVIDEFNTHKAESATDSNPHGINDIAVKLDMQTVISGEVTRELTDGVYILLVWVFGTGTGSSGLYLVHKWGTNGAVRDIVGMGSGYNIDVSVTGSTLKVTRSSDNFRISLIRLSG